MLLYLLSTFRQVGITSKSVEERYKGSNRMPYKYEVVQEIKDISDNVYNLEVLIKNYISVNSLKYLR